MEELKEIKEMYGDDLIKESELIYIDKIIFLLSKEDFGKLTAIQKRYIEEIS